MNGGGSHQAHDYYIIASWYINAYALSKDVNVCLNCSASVGPPDGWAIATNMPVTVQGASTSYWGDYWFGTTTSSSPSQLSQNGAAFKGQDRVHSGPQMDDSTVSNGQEVFDFYHLVNGCHTNFQPFFAYGHTWSSTSINGFGFGPYSASVSFTSSTGSWQNGVAGNIISAC